MQERRAHWMRENRAARTPRRVICLDSESSHDFDGRTETQDFLCAVASFDRLDTDAKPEAETDWYRSLDTKDLWSWIVSKTHAAHRTVVFAHNLSYDLRITDALGNLPALGFDVRQIALNDYSCWAYLSDGKRSLYLVDSYSFLPKSLESLAAMVNQPRLRRQPEHSDIREWIRHCEMDVSILRRVVLGLLEVLKEHDLGDFRTTGAGQGSAAFRHRFLRPKTLLVHSDEEALAAERRAVHAGRAEVWKHGRIDGPLHEYDFTAAYATIGRDYEMPVRLRGEFFPANLEAYDKCREHYAMLCDVKVSTDVPTVPTQADGRILWPCGSFTSTLWDCEIQLARENGATVDVSRMWAFHRAPLLREWASWILDALDGNGLGSDPIGRLLAKEWSRSLIGRFGLRYPILIEQGQLPTSDVKIYPVRDTIEERSYTGVQLGRIEYEQTERVESPNSTPAVMGYVMAVARVRLWKAMEAVGFDNVISVDTDGLIVAEHGANVLDESVSSDALLGLRRKKTYLSGEFRGPRNMDLDNERRVSGVPRKAEKIGDGKYRGEVWESLTQSIRRQRASSVIVSEREFTVSDHDPRRIHLDNGETRAVRLEA